MADASALELFMKAIGITGPASIGVVAGAVIRGLLDGSAAQTKELRSAMTDQNTRLHLDNDRLDGMTENLKRERDILRYQRDSARTQRNRAWDRINSFEVQAGVPPSVWPPDSPEPGEK